MTGRNAAWGAGLLGLIILMVLVYQKVFGTVTAVHPDSAFTREFAASPIVYDPATSISHVLRDRYGKTLTPDAAHEIARSVINASIKSGVPREVILGVMQVESGFKSNARGREGDTGLMQVRPPAAIAVDWITKKHAQSWAEWRTGLNKPMVNALVGASYIQKLHSDFHEPEGQYFLSLLAYNAGPTAVRRAISRSDKLSLKYYGKVRKAIDSWE